MKLVRRLKVLFALSFVALAGCSASDSPAPDGPASGRSEVTYYEQIAPLLERNCIGCHHTGDGVAPFALDSYAAVRARASAVRAATLIRQMPPWNIDNTGKCQTFKSARWLSDAEIAQIDSWVKAGMPEGDRKSFQAAVPHEMRLEGDVLELKAAEPYAPQPGALQADDYRCFLIDPKLDRDRYVTAYDVIPGDPRIVHHAVAYTVNLDLQLGMDAAGRPLTNKDSIAALQSKEGGRPGWPCYGAAGDGIAISGMALPGWAPGVGLTELPHQTGLPIRRGEQVILQIHYHLGHVDHAVTTPGVELVDQTAIRLRLADSVPRAAHTLVLDPLLDSLFSPNPAQIPAGQPDFVFSSKIGAADFQKILSRAGQGSRPWLLAGVYPHMHQTGIRQRLTIETEAGNTCGADVDRWNFNWQQYYFYDQPVNLAGLKSFEISCEYDTTKRDKATRPGFGSEDEMCLMGLYLVEDLR
jgi:mono/diheme cytochrome c family protein